MTIQDRILDALRKTDRLCDDCLSEITGVKPRQAINLNSRAMAAGKALMRPTEDCARCRRAKIVNRLVTARQPPSPASPPHPR